MLPCVFSGKQCQGPQLAFSHNVGSMARSGQIAAPDCRPSGVVIQYLFSPSGPLAAPDCRPSDAAIQYPILSFYSSLYTFDYLYCYSLSDYLCFHFVLLLGSLVGCATLAS